MKKFSYLSSIFLFTCGFAFGSPSSDPVPSSDAFHKSVRVETTNEGSVYYLNVQPQYLNDIINGKKIFEGRLNLPTFKDMQQGDHVIFADNNKRIAICSITSVARYPDFTKMLVSCGVLNMLPQIDPNSNSSIEMVTKGDEIYRSFPGYSEGEKIYGTLAIGIHYISVEAIEK